VPRLSRAGKGPSRLDPCPRLARAELVAQRRADGSGKKQLTNATSNPMTSRLPSWSPDGRKIVFSSWLSEIPERAVVAVMNADGSHFRKLTKPKGASVDYWPVWASDGRIYFYRIDTSGDALYEYSVKPDGSGLTRIMELGSYPQYMLHYGISPDGRRVALQDVTADRLEVLPVGGGKAVTLLDPATDYLGDILAVVGWSPDQKSLAIAGLFDNGGTRLYIVNADGSGLSAVPGIDAARDPDWRPE
jgi:Tol biopolymer transport system component